MPLPLEVPKLTICGLEPSKQALLDAIASKKASLISSLKNKLTAASDMAAANIRTGEESLIQKLLSNVHLIPDNYKADIAKLLMDIIAHPENASALVNAMVLKWGTDKQQELTQLVQDFIDGKTVHLCNFANLEKLGSALPTIKPPESFPAFEAPTPVVALVPTVVGKSEAPNPDLLKNHYAINDNT
jgi:hypothetical protein